MRKLFTYSILAMLLVSSFGAVGIFAKLDITLTLSYDTIKKGYTQTITASGGEEDVIWMLEITNPSGDAVWAAQGVFDESGVLEYAIVIPPTLADGEYTVLFKTGVDTFTTTFIIDNAVSADESGGGTNENLTPEEIANIYEPTNPQDIADMLDEYTPDYAAQILQYMASETIVQVIMIDDPQKLADIFNDMNSTQVADILNTAVNDNATEEVATILLDMDDQAAADALVGATTDNAAAIIEAMAAQNINGAAQTVEDCIKLFTQGMNDTKKAEIAAKMAVVLDNLTVQSLVDLFIEIANLPQTPSTVAAAFEIMNLNIVLDVVSGMSEASAWTELSKVFDYLTTATLGSIWRGMLSSERQTLYPYLTAATIARLPDLGAYTLSELSITPAAVESGKPVTVTVKVTNAALEAGTYDAVLKVNGVTQESKSVNVAASGSATVSFTVTKTTAGTYTVAVGDLSGSFKVTAANISVTKVELSKTTVKADETVTVTVTLENTGNASGTYPLKLTLDGSEKQSESVTVAAGATTTKTYTVSSSVTGQHTVATGSQSAQFTVEAETVIPPPTTPDYTIYILGGVVIIVAAVAIYFLFLKKKK